MNSFLYRVFFCFFMSIFLCPIASLAQTTDTIKGTTNILDSVTIRAYGSKTALATPAAVNYIGVQQLARFADFNTLQAVNSTPGVRMEERSFGSYRLSIRGSSLRSPYGVRNVKLYYDEIPFTAPGGNSMLNMLGFYNFGSLEVIKGPAGSRYSAGTGGVLLINAPKNDRTTLANTGISAGSYGLLAVNAALQYKGHAISYERLRADGYREHTEMKKQVVSYSGQLVQSKVNSLKLHFIYSDLTYETPGALTLSEYNVNPRAARPRVGATQSAIEANAVLHQEAALLGLKNRYTLSDRFVNTTTLYGFYNETKSQAIQNVEYKKEPHWGGRTVFNYDLKTFDIDFGGEFQQGDFSSITHKNLNGNKGLVLTDDELQLAQWMGFMQLNWKYKSWLLTVGASVNGLALDFKRKNVNPIVKAHKNYAGEIQPRFAALYALSRNFSAYVNITKGFSPPASSEIFADNSSYNLALAPEEGWSLEPGFRGTIFEKATVDLSVFSTQLTNSIVTRRDAAGANYFLNAGKIKQEGLEASFSYRLFSEQNPWSVLLQGAYALHHFKYAEFIQLNQDFSGKKLPGVSPNTFTMMADLKYKSTWSAYLSYTYSDKIPLNDANTESANEYQLLSLKLGYKKHIHKIPLQIFAGADNLLNQTYSLGNDINGFGGRYYNVAPARSFYLGCKIGFTTTR